MVVWGEGGRGEDLLGALFMAAPKRPYILAPPLWSSQPFVIVAWCVGHIVRNWKRRFVAPRRAGCVCVCGRLDIVRFP